MTTSIDIISTTRQDPVAPISLLHCKAREDHLPMNLGQTVRRLRTEQNIGMNEFADMVGVDRASMSRFERNKQGFSIETLEKIAKALGMKLSELIEEAEEGGGDPRKRAMLNLWEKLSPDQRDALFRLLGAEADKQAK